MSQPRFYHPAQLAIDTHIELAPNASRHVQVLRMQPQMNITLFDGHGGEYEATILDIGRSKVSAQVKRFDPVEREASREIHLAVGMPANERMDWLVEKATELGVSSIQPLMTERGVLKLSGERAEKKRAHWEAIAISASEQCGRNRIPAVHPIQNLPAWLKQFETPNHMMLGILSLHANAKNLAQLPNTKASLFLSGAEGGLSAAEEQAALAKGFCPINLGNRVLRAETAALAALAQATVSS